MSNHPEAHAEYIAGMALPLAMLIGVALLHVTLAQIIEERN